MKKLALFFFISALTVTFAKSQILSPQQLKEVHSLKEVKDITLKLSNTGYKENDNVWDENEAGRSFTWHFQNKPGETFDFLLMRIEEKNGNIETHYYISNIYLYKQFVDNLIKEKYKVAGAAIIDDKNHIVFKKKNISFLIAELLSANNEANYVVRVKGSTTPNKKAQPLASKAPNTTARNH